MDVGFIVVLIALFGALASLLAVVTSKQAIRDREEEIARLAEERNKYQEYLLRFVSKGGLTNEDEEHFAADSEALQALEAVEFEIKTLRMKLEEKRNMELKKEIKKTERQQ